MKQSPKGESPLEQTQGCRQGGCSEGQHHPPQPRHASRLGFPLLQASRELQRRVQVEDVPPNPQQPSSSGNPGGPSGPSNWRRAWWWGAEHPPPGGTASWRRRRRPWERHRRGASSLCARSSLLQGAEKSSAEAFLKPDVYVCACGVCVCAYTYIPAYIRVPTDACV